MKTLGTLQWVHKQIPIEEKLKNKNQVDVLGVECINPREFPIDFGEYCKHPLLLVTGDGHTMPDEVKAFESWGIPHDVYCANRSLLYFQRPVTHWGAVDCEENVWFSENVTANVMPNGRKILRHTIGILPYGFDVFWRADNFEEMMGYAKNLWSGNTVYMAMLSSFVMGYKKVILAGVPLDTGRHWYEPEGTEGPNWVGKVYRQWMDFKMKIPQAGQIRSMGGYSAFILGTASKEWANGSNTA